ncbi:hypothetical protein [Deinococcus sp.]|uniref:hypothetical protein n=1 Tax=Deinococcus sp. TaxID=47478 RepID=UPI0025B950CA|nr:hypothetical protein [Deinococcus sp.]
MTISPRNAPNGKILKITPGAVHVQMAYELADEEFNTWVIPLTAAKNDALPWFMRSGANDHYCFLAGRPQAGVRQ